MEDVLNGRPERYVTDIEHAGFNLLGLAEIFALIGGMRALTELDAHLNRWVGLALGMALLIGVPAFDVKFRLAQPELSRCKRLFAPFCGGSLLYVPFWLFLPVFLMVAITLAIVQHR